MESRKAWVAECLMMEPGMRAWITECLMETSDWRSDRVDSKTDVVYQGGEALYALRFGEWGKVEVLGLDGLDEELSSDFDTAFNRYGHSVCWKDELLEHASFLMGLCK